MRYARRMSAAATRTRGRRDVSYTWSPLTAYALGLVATDGNLGRDGRRVSFGSTDYEQVATLLRCVDHPTIRIARDRDDLYFRAQISDRELHEFLAAAGLTPNKSLTLGALVFPEGLFWDVVRGLLDGDGSIRSYVHNPIARAYPIYRYERLEVKFHTASLVHAKWLHQQFGERGLRSALITAVRRGDERDRVLFKVQMGKHASIHALANMYRDPNSPRLHRKWVKWEAFRAKFSDEEARALVRRTGAKGRSFASIAEATKFELLP